MREYSAFTVTAVHPGVVQTNLMVGAGDPPLLMKIVVTKVFHGLLIEVEKGIKNQVWAASGPRAGRGHGGDTSMGPGEENETKNSHDGECVESGEYYKTVG